jgi:glycosyltransferase involved in cell wall biosynthesis
MRILHWYSNFLGGGATANAVLGLAEAQARLSAQVSIATAEASQAPLYGSMLDSTSSDIDLIQWKPSWTLKRGNFILRGLSKGTRQALADWRPEVVHIHGEFNADNLRVPALFQCPIVLSPHGAFAPEVFLKSRRAVKSAYFLIATLFLYRHVKTFHALCPMEGEHITKLLPEAKVYQVPEGPNIRVAQAMIAESQARADQTIKLLFVGRLDIFTKGLDLLL